jgi:hypothetical protein
MAFVKDEPAKAASLVASMQKLTETYKAKDLRAFVVFVKGAEAGPEIQKIAADKKINISMAFLPQGPTQGDLAPYKINEDFKNTVLVYVNKKVQANITNVDDKSFDKVAKATDAMLKK